jgi:undecaprenyl-diphosphatase
MNSFDSAILKFLNQFVHHSQLLDRVVYVLAFNPFFKGVLIVAVCWWIWFQPGPNNRRHRQIVVAAFASAVLAVIIGRLMAHFMPFRMRPLQTPELNLVIPFNENDDTMRGWNSFPSDHAMVFFAISTCLWYVSRRLGLIMTLYVSLIVGLARVYLSLHYPSDVIGGALIGVLFAQIACLPAVRERLAAPFLRWSEAHPASFYTGFLLFSQQMAVMFNPLRHLGRYLNLLS